MFRPLLALLLITNLMACPLRCARCDAGPPVETSASASCSCCSDCSLTSGESGSFGAAATHAGAAATHDGGDPLDRPGGDCQCKSCICEGAILESSPDAASVPLHAVVLWTQSLLRSVDLSLCRASRPLDGDDLAGRYRGGRDVRIAHQSWLI